MRKNWTDNTKIRLSLGQKIWAVVGANNNPDKFGNKIYRALKSAGLEVYPVNPMYEEVDGDKCFKTIESLPIMPDIINIVVTPKRVYPVLESLEKIGHNPELIWFQPGTYDDELIEFAGERHPILHGRCILIELGHARKLDAHGMAASVKWLKEKLAQTGAGGFVLGVSGGIDSAVAANLAAKAAPTKEDVRGIILPIEIEGTGVPDISPAQAVIDAAGICGMTIDLTDERKAVLEKSKKAAATDVAGNSGEKFSIAASGNLSARLRMSVLYLFANQTNSLVVGTDNAAELLIGYFTKYGDGAADVLAISGLLKTDVYRWARLLKVPRQVYETAPTAGLWAGQTDEEEIGISYDEIDAYILGEDVGEKAKQIIERMDLAAGHKRMAPPGSDIKIIWEE